MVSLLQIRTLSLWQTQRRWHELKSHNNVSQYASGSCAFTCYCLLQGMFHTENRRKQMKSVEVTFRLDVLICARMVGRTKSACERPNYKITSVWVTHVHISAQWSKWFESWFKSCSTVWVQRPHQMWGSQMVNHDQGNFTEFCTKWSTMSPI